MIPPEDLQLAAFDLDGVVADTELLHKEAKALMLRRFGVAAADVDAVDFRRFVGLPNEKFWTEMRAAHPAITGTMDELETKQFHVILELMREKSFPPSEGLLPLLELLAERGVACAMHSSSMRFYVEEALEFFGIRRFFAVVVAGDELARRKPFPDGYLKAASLAGAVPARSIAIEDSTAGVAAAKAAGMFAVGYRNPTSGEQDLSRADSIVDSLAEIAAALK